MLGSSSALHDGSSSVVAGQKDLIEFICQCRDGGIVQVRWTFDVFYELLINIVIFLI